MPSVFLSWYNSICSVPLLWNSTLVSIDKYVTPPELIGSYAFSSKQKLLVYSRIAKCLGFRRTFQVGVLLFGTVCVLIPFSNKISGPVPGSSTSSNVTDLWSGSGSGNSTDFCGDDSDDGVGVNEDSMERIPYYIWLLLSLVYGAMVISRYNITCIHVIYHRVYYMYLSPVFLGLCLQ